MLQSGVPLRRVVVTGIGVVSPLGNTLLDSWSAVLRNENGMTTLEEAITQHQHLSEETMAREMEMARALPCQVAAPVKGVDNDNRTARFVKMALLAGAEAYEQANLESWLGTSEMDDEKSEQRRSRIGACVGSGMSGVREISEALHLVEGSGSIKRLSPHFIPKVLTNSAAGRLSLEYQLRGPNLSPSTACAASSHAIGDAMRCIQHNSADVMLAGGAEACIDPLSMAGFCRLRALSTSFSPGESSRPFDKSRDGFVMGEGAAILVLEELNHAKERQATILAELAGFGASGDAFHITAPDIDGRGACRAMEIALQQTRSDRSSIGYVNAHATSTPQGDEIEARVINKVLQASCDNGLFVSSTKGATGHLLGAAGAIEAAFTVMSLIDKVVPPNNNLVESNFEPTAFQFATSSEHVPSLHMAISNSFGFGGTNASLVFKSYDDIK
jgi:3-oxoacyl-[acyl-carrier-protein] synthase II